MVSDNIFDNEDYLMNSDYAKHILFDPLDSKDIEKINALLLENPKFVNAKTAKGHVTALMSAAGFSKNRHIIELLISRGAEVNAKDCNGWTALMWGICQKDNLEFLISKGADVNMRALDGMTPLMRATDYGNVEIIEILISHGADLNMKNNKGQTALMIAEVEGHKEIVDLLRKHGAKE